MFACWLIDGGALSWWAVVLTLTLDSGNGEVGGKQTVDGPSADCYGPAICTMAMGLLIDGMKKTMSRSAGCGMSEVRLNFAISQG